MDKFLLATNPMRPGKGMGERPPELFIIHAIHPLAIIRCDLSTEPLPDGFVIAQFDNQLTRTVKVEHPSYNGAMAEEWTLTAIQLDCNTDVDQLLKRAWRWFYSYRNMFPLQFTIYHYNAND